MLEAVAPDSLRPLLHDLFAANTFRELAAEQVSTVPAPGGMVELTLAVPASAAWAGADPRSLPFDLEPWNNVARLPLEK